MLDRKTIEVVKATVPVLEAGGEALTRHFYQRMFSKSPEVLPFFNPVSQAAGTQQRALAAAICSYAANIDNLGALGDAVELIANKHASLRVKPEHYPIVGENLLESIKEVLGDGATDDVIEAWGKAYFFLADILINRETQIYDEQETADGGWQDFKSFKITKKVEESDVVTSFYLEPADGLPLPSFKAGQYITVRVPSPCGHTTMRNYSLSDKPGQDHFRISVKREEAVDGSAEGYVSNMLHRTIDEGHLIDLAPPCGEFFLDTETNRNRPLVLLAAGVGITPLLSILSSSLEKTPQRDVVLIQASLHERNQAFRETIDALARQHPNFTRHYRYSEPSPHGVTRSTEDCVSEGFVDPALIKSLANTLEADFYFCGPKPFMVTLYRDLIALGVAPNQLHFEFFGPRQEIENSQSNPVGISGGFEAA